MNMNMYKKRHNIMNISHESFSRIIYTILALSLFVIFFGVSGIIEHKSPDNLASLTTLSSAFITYFKYHILIICGALCFTFAVWFMRNDSQ